MWWNLDCGGNPATAGATPLWLWSLRKPQPKRRRRCALPAHSRAFFRFIASIRVQILGVLTSHKAFHAIPGIVRYDDNLLPDKPRLRSFVRQFEDFVACHRGFANAPLPQQPAKRRFPKGVRLVMILIMVWIGTSGFQYPEWKGTFYPPDLPAPKMLAYYADRFRTTEINYTFYRIPNAKTLYGWSAGTPGGFRFSLKAPKKITHTQKLRDCQEVLDYFWKMAGRLNEKLGAVLFQLPPYFRKDAAVLKAFLDMMPQGMKGAFEFRHASWFDDEVFTALRSKNAALCVADSEKLTTPAVFTARHGYLRLRDATYTEEDIRRWAATIAEQQRQLEDIYVYFKHEESGIGPQLARQLTEVLSAT